MAIKFFDCKGFSQIEPNQVWFNRAGMSEAQCALDPEKFASKFPMTPADAAANKIYGEVGAFLMVDKVKGLATVPTTAGNDAGLNMGINYSTERIYNQFTPGRRNFCMITGEFYPRIGYVEPGMRITTNAVAWDDTKKIGAAAAAPADSDALYADVKAAVKAGTEVYAYVANGSDGKMVLTTTVGDLANALGEVYAHVVKVYDNADGTDSFMFEFIKKPAAV